MGMITQPLDMDSLVLLKGAHPANDGMCAMEAVAFLAGEPHSDAPKCACPIISTFVRKWNDDLDDAGRQRLKPYLPRLIGTRSTRVIEQRRGWLIADWLIRVHTPAWLHLAKLEDQAKALEGLPELADLKGLKAGAPTIYAARDRAAAAWDAARAAAGAAAGAAARAAAWDAAGAAARDAAGAAARAAAWDAAGAAAWAAARDAAGAAARAAARAAAWDAAGAAAWDAAGDAAWDAAGAAARDAARAAAGAAARAAAGAAARAAAGDAARAALEPTKLSLQDSALKLLDRLIETKAA